MRVALFILIVLTFTLSIVSHGALQNKTKLTKNIQNEIKKTGRSKVATTKIRHTKVLVPNKISNFIIKSIRRSTKSKKLKKLIIENKLRVIPDKSTKITNIKFFKSKIFTNIVTKKMQKQSRKLKYKHTTLANHKTIKIKIMEVARHVVSKKNIPNKIVNSKSNSARTVSKFIKNNLIDHHTSKKSRKVFKNNSKDKPIKALGQQNQRLQKTLRFTKKWPSSKLLPLKKIVYKNLKGVPQNDRTIKLDVKKYKYDTLTNFSKLMMKSIVSKRNTIPNRLFNKLTKVKSTNKKLQDMKSLGLRYNKSKPLNSKNINDARVNNVGLKNVKHNVVTKKISSTSKKPSSRAKYKNLKPRSLEINVVKHKQIKTTKPFKSKINIPRKNTLKTLGHKKLSSSTKSKFKTSVRKLTTTKRVAIKKITTKKNFPVIKKEYKNPSNFFRMFMDSQEMHETLRKKKSSGSTNILSKTNKKLKTKSSTRPKKSLETNTKVFTTIATSSTKTFYISPSANATSIETPSTPIISGTSWTTENDQITSTNINPKSTTSNTMLNITDDDNSSLPQTSNVRYVRKTRWIKKTILRKKTPKLTSSRGGILEPQYDNVEFDLPMTLVNRILSFDEEPIESLKIIDAPVPLGIKPAAIKNHPFKQAGPNRPLQLTPGTKVRKNRLPLVDYDFLSGTKLKKMVSHDSTRLIMIGTITFLAVMLAFVAILVFCIAFT